MPNEVSVKTKLINNVQKKMADHYFKKHQKAISVRKKDKAVNVAFIVQMPAVWDKQIGLFEMLSSDDGFNAYIIVAPNYSIKKGGIDYSDYSTEFYKNRYGDSHIIIFEKETVFEDICNKYDIDYVFYDRPYNFYLPDELKTNNTLKYCATCNINYCTFDWDTEFLYDEFAKYIMNWYATSSDEYDCYNQFYCNMKYRRCYNYGYPAYETYANLLNVGSTDKTILWTPRWSYDEKTGGSHFVEYIDNLIDYFATHKDYNLVIRPHPIMFENFISKGIMTAERVDEIHDKCENAGIRFDDNALILDTFRDTAILLADNSSVINMYMTSGRPVIYCPTDNIVFSKEFNELVEGMYVAEDWDSIVENIENLNNGIDPLKEKRELIQNDLNSIHGDSISKIVDSLR